MSLIAFALDQRADVYTIDPSTGPSGGRYTQLLKSKLPCRLAHMPLNRIQRPSDRAEYAALRNMLYPGDFNMPEQCQVLVDGVRWQPVPGTFGKPRDWTSRDAYGRCDVMRQQVSSF